MAFKIIGSTPGAIERKRLKEAASVAFLYLGGEFEVNLKFVTAEEMRELNRVYRGKDITTDVLSFVLDPNIPGGDIVVYYEDLMRDTVEWGLTEQEMACFLVVHGILHLSGYDHTNAPDRAKMEKAEGEILTSLGIKLERQI